MTEKNHTQSTSKRRPSEFRKKSRCGNRWYSGCRNRTLCVLSNQSDQVALADLFWSSTWCTRGVAADRGIQQDCPRPDGDRAVFRLINWYPPMNCFEPCNPERLMRYKVTMPPCLLRSTSVFSVDIFHSPPATVWTCQFFSSITGLDEIWAEAYGEVEGVEWISAGAWDPLHIFTREPIRSLADMKGKRVFGVPTAGRFLSRYGLVPVTLPWDDIEVAIGTGELGWSCLVRFHGSVRSGLGGCLQLCIAQQRHRCLVWIVFCQYKKLECTDTATAGTLSNVL